MGIAGILLLPFALDGESATPHNTALDVVALVSMVGGYLLLAALWYFVFRGKARAKRRRDSSD
jgi:hypothetical protein